MSAEPFLKWAGGKRNLLDRLLPLFPPLNPEGTYFEPFLGGGAVFFRLRPNRAVLSDINVELIEVFVAVRDDVEAVVIKLAGLPYSESDYYKIRAWRPTDLADRAARLIYLNKTCFNGLFRVNQRGEFNVPFGRHGPNVEICNELQLRAASAALKSAVFAVGDFEETLCSAQAGDFVYLDPPYTTAHASNGFIEYNAKVFSWADQRRLARVAEKLVDRGVSVVVSNADHSSIIDCYTRSDRFEPRRIQRWSTIASRATKRFQTTEVVLVGRMAAGVTI
jgi:DNA adenine methylase